MNLPNKLTMMRIIMIPLFLFFLLWDIVPGNELLALLTFALAAITDTLDGQIARRRNLVTDFGKLMDPLADKLLVMSALLPFVEVQDVPAVVIVIILAREFMVTSLRLIAVEKGVVIAADIWGKVKTVLQMFWIVYTLLLRWLASLEMMIGGPLTLIYQVGMVLVVVATVLSGINYMYKNHKLFTESI